MNKYIPNIFTLGNLLFGVLSLKYTIDKNWQMAAIMILFCSVLDSMDGKLARRLDAISSFGKELDSLCDLVSFGVAPALLVYGYRLDEMLNVYGLIIAVMFALCGAIRLARFNVLNISDYFVGVPITAAGSFMSLLVLVGAKVPDLIFPILMILFSYLMVSNIKVPKY